MIRGLITIILLGLVGSSCNSPTAMVKPTSLDTVKAKIITLRKYGFFERYSWSSNEDMFDSLYETRIADYSRVYHRFVDPGMQVEDYQLLYLDKERSVFGDSKAGVFEGRYVDLITAFGKASNGLFTPTNITEKWESDTGPITVSFIHKEERIEFKPKQNNDWLCEQVFEIINVQMTKNGPQKFYRFLGTNGQGLGQYFLYVRMTKEQKNRLEATFPWKFSRD